MADTFPSKMPGERNEFGEKNTVWGQIKNTHPPNTYKIDLEASMSAK